VLEGGEVVIVKLALAAPAATVTLAGILAIPGSWLDRSTGTPPAGAGLWSVTVPVAELPPLTLVALTLKPDSTAEGGGTVPGLTVMSAVWVRPKNAAEIVAEVEVDTALVATVKLARWDAGDTVTLAGTLATGFLLESVTLRAADGA